MQRPVTSQTATKAARTRRSACKYPCTGGSTGEHRVGGLCEKRVTLLVTLRVRCLVFGDSAWAEAVAIVIAPRSSGTGSGRLDADGEERR
jgi:hypothetical protein